MVYLKSITNPIINPKRIRGYCSICTNIPLATALDVGANADSTGGNAASTMDIYVQYVIIDTSI